MPTKTDRILSYLPGTFRALPRPTTLYAVVDAFGNELLLAENSLAAIMQAHWVDHADRGAEAIDDLAGDGPTAAEMGRGVARSEAAFLSRLQTVGGFGGKSDQLNAYNVLCGDPGWFGHDLDRYRQASAEAVRDAAAQYLTRAPRVLLSVVPDGHPEAALPRSVPVAVS